MRALWQRIRTAARTGRAALSLPAAAASSAAAASRPTAAPLWRRATWAAVAAGGIGVAAGSTAVRALLTPLATAKAGASGGAGEDAKACKSCPPGMEAVMKHLGKRSAEQQQRGFAGDDKGRGAGGGAGKAATAVAAAGAAAVGAAVVATRGGTGESSSPSADAAPAAAAPAAAAAASREPLPCPPDYIALGSSTWTFLHAMAQHYPPASDEDDADPLQPRGTASPLLQHRTRELLTAMAHVYPCASCAAHMRAYIAAHPPDVTNGPALQQWLCRFHNAVNADSGKPQFDCSRLDERWGNGPKGADAARCA